MAYCDYNCEDLPDHGQVSCGEYHKGGSSSAAIIECAQATLSNFSNATQWTDAIANGEVKLIEPIVLEVTEPSAVEGENPSGCGPATKLDTFDREVTFRDFNITEGNIDFYNALNKRTTYFAWYNCAADTVEYVLTSVTYVARKINPVREDEKAHWLVTAKWRSLDAPEMVTAPAGIFNQN